MADRRQYVVWGLGRFGSSVALNLKELGHEVLGIDSSEEAVQSISDELTHVVLSDVMDENTVKALGIRNFDGGIVGMGDLEASLLCTMLFKEAGLPIIVAKATTPLHGKMLEKLGATQVIYPERDMGRRVAYHLAYSNILDYVEISAGLSLMETNVFPNMIGKNLIDLNIRQNYGVNVVAIKHADGTTKINIDPQEIFKKDDVLVIVGPKDTMLKLESGLK